jgi:hypothetical protein
VAQYFVALLPLARHILQIGRHVRGARGGVFFGFGPDLRAVKVAWGRAVEACRLWAG